MTTTIAIRKFSNDNGISPRLNNNHLVLTAYRKLLEFRQVSETRVGGKGQHLHNSSPKPRPSTRLEG
ncbi:hypothetical protein BaRGS_00021783 [Batillaria attramentaria]|uniref:Uncharacterized protein n=1 Tax=Batillaria attramentaria TaxID=370345 RepID=A0ABD0KJ12_9CAEN